MRVVVGMATTAERVKYSQKAIKSLEQNTIQPEIWLYNNGKNSQDLTDNGKFYGLRMIKEPCYYFTCDDDIIYPPNYIESMIAEIDKHNCIITHHGRILRGENKNYYTDHIGFRCLSDQYNTTKIDVCGTGVTAWRTDYFNPIDICYSEDKRMADLVFSLEATKQGKKIMIVPHVKGWLKDLKVPEELTIYYMEKDKSQRQMELANSIFKLNPTF